ncbi:glycosyltransferase family 2 protein [Vreelandella titanicae]|uniref:Glycosyltransferase family 2 protein n=1 Tax=Vreelandella titanicae TaxID=664683 RepID=A0A558J1P1_9GAMM|nr:glycosyltransferase family 2 protein [Halomonas titanicae]TVU87581.1 glycosyltransferase family 2 protein [Halomonas titanicae]
MNARNRERLEKGWRWLAKVLKNIPWVSRPTDRLKARSQLLPLEACRLGYAWQAIGDDPQFLLKRGLPLPGWQMLEVAIDHDQPSAAVQLFFNCGKGFKEESSVYLPLKSGRITKRLFWMPFRVKTLRLDPLESEGNFTIRHLRFVWLTPWFAHDRLAQRLANMHYKWRNVPKRQVIKALKEQAVSSGRPWREVALETYEATFERFSVQRSYGDWIAGQVKPSEAELANTLNGLAFKPLVSVLVPVYNPTLEHLKSCLDSVLSQAYPYWQLCIADDASTDPAVAALLADYVEQDRRVHVVTRENNGHICAASNSALALAEGEYIALLDHDDCLANEALLEMVAALNQNPQARLLYSDEDKLDEREQRIDPHFKPDWNPDLLLAQNYISHLGMYETDLVREVGGFREGFEGSQDYDLVLRITAHLTPEQIVHVPKVLYHWRAVEGSTAMDSGQKDYTSQAGLDAVKEHVTTCHPGARVEHGAFANTYRIRWPMPNPEPLVSLLVPTRDRVEILKPCVDAILSRTNYHNFELLILDNQSTCSETLDYMDKVASQDSRVRVLRWEQPFNYSAINNFGAQQAKGTIIGLVNNDIEPINSDWLTEMVSQVSRPEIGCVGAKLYYPNDTIQHAGVILGIGGVAGHAHKYFTRHAIGYFTRLHLAHNLSAVTAACMLVRKSVFDEVGGLNEAHLAVAFNDVDFCLKVREAGYRNLWTPYAELYHHESISRGADDNAKKRARAAGEVAYMRETWADKLDSDPAYNPNLTLVHEDFSLR